MSLPNGILDRSNCSLHLTLTLDNRDITLDNVNYGFNTFINTDRLSFFNTIYLFTPAHLNLDYILSLKKADPDQLASDQDPHCFLFSILFCGNKLKKC